MGRLYYQIIHGGYWSSNIYTIFGNYRLGMYGVRLDGTMDNNKCYGFTLRCVTVSRFFLSTGSLGARSYPLSYVYSGYYYWATGRLYNQTLGGLYWSSTIYNSSSSYRLTMDGSSLAKAYAHNKRVGNALRCTIRLTY